jgi:plasmid maintenance system antidote protein VapI
MAIDEQLRRALAERPESARAIARACGVPQPMITRFLNGSRGLSLVTAARLCDYLGLELALQRRRNKRSK